MESDRNPLSLQESEQLPDEHAEQELRQCPLQRAQRILNNHVEQELLGDYFQARKLFSVGYA